MKKILSLILLFCIISCSKDTSNKQGNNYFILQYGNNEIFETQNIEYNVTDFNHNIIGFNNDLNRDLFAIQVENNQLIYNSPISDFKIDYYKFFGEDVVDFSISIIDTTKSHSLVIYNKNIPNEIEGYCKFYIISDTFSNLLSEKNLEYKINFKINTP